MPDTFASEGHSFFPVSVPFSLGPNPNKNPNNNTESQNIGDLWVKIVEN